MKNTGLPQMSTAIAEPTAHDPDARGHFGPYGGRYVAEALMAVIEEVTAAYERSGPTGHSSTNSIACRPTTWDAHRRCTKRNDLVLTPAAHVSFSNEKT